MARQKLIHLHTSGNSTTNSVLLTTSPLELGEIAVQHNSGDSAIYIRLSDPQSGEELNQLGKFITESAIDLKISSSATDFNQAINTINGKIGGNFDSTNTVAAAISAETTARIEGDQAIVNSVESVEDSVDELSAGLASANTAIAAEVSRATNAESALDTRVSTNEGKLRTIEGQLSGFSSTAGSVKDYVDAQTSAITNTLDSISAASPASDYVTVTVSQKANKTQSIGVAVDVQEISSSTATKQGLADAYDVKSELGSRDTIIAGHTSSIATINSQLSGFGSTAGSVKSYVDDAVSNAVTSVYKVKGSVATYADLPSNNLTEGDVYNVVAAYGNYPAGTNWVWVDPEEGEQAGHWDPLGGSIDLSPYLEKSDFNDYSAATKTVTDGLRSDLTTAQGAISAEVTRAEAAEAALDSRLDEVEASIGTGAVAEKLAELEMAITAETAARQSADSDMATDISTNASDISTINGKLGNGFSSQSTVTSQLAAVKTTADSAVQTVSVANSAANGITASKSGTTVTLNFNEMVIDCGTYGQE